MSLLIILPPANPFEHHRPAVGGAALLSRTSLFETRKGILQQRWGGNPAQPTKRNSIVRLIFIVIIFARIKQVSFSNALYSWDVWNFTFLSIFLDRINSIHGSGLLYPYSSFDKKEDAHLSYQGLYSSYWLTSFVGNWGGHKQDFHPPALSVHQADSLPALWQG